jgi:hypothetical protein
VNSTTYYPLGKTQEKIVWSIYGTILLTQDIVLLVSINNFEPNLILVNVNKLNPYKYVDQTLKGIQSLENQKKLESIDFDHMDENL